MNVALYARYSSDNQRDASIEDQLRLTASMPRSKAGRSSTAIATAPFPVRRCSAPASRS
jgi:hypothetical protein